MISFNSLILDDKSPIYLQIVMFIKRSIASGEVTLDDEMPSRRGLSALLGVNPNTAQKAYAALEEEGLIRSMPGKGSFIFVSAVPIASIRQELCSGELPAILDTAKKSVLGKAETMSLLIEVCE